MGMDDRYKWSENQYTMTFAIQSDSLSRNMCFNQFRLRTSISK